MSNFIPASPRQLWALYCITKNDYRDKNLSKDEAARLISEMGNPNYKKKSKGKTTIKDELLDYIKDNFDDIFGEASKSLKLRSTVTMTCDGKEKNYAFIGYGCGFTWLTYDKRSKIGKEIEQAAKEIRNKEVRDLFIKQFTNTERKYFENIGCPLEAIWAQDMNIQCSYYHVVAQFGQSKGVKKMCYDSRLD